MLRTVSLTAALSLTVLGSVAGIANAAPATTFGEGDHVVGVDIAPGTYVGSGTADDLLGCRWERRSGSTGERSDIIAWDRTHSVRVIVTIEPTDKVFSSEHCGTWTRIPRSRPQARPAPAAPSPLFGS